MKEDVTEVGDSLEVTGEVVSVAVVGDVLEELVAFTPSVV